METSRIPGIWQNFQVLKIEIVAGIDAKPGRLCRDRSGGKPDENRFDALAGECLSVGLRI